MNGTIVRRETMNASIEIEGTLQEDGTLVLDHKPNLPPGRVRVKVQSVADYTQTEIWQFFQHLNEERQRLGLQQDQETIDAYIAEMRDDDERSGMIEQIHEECQRGKTPSSEKP